MSRNDPTLTTSRTTSRLGLFAWCSYDWANSAFPTIIVTFIFSAYFAKAVAADEISGTSDWAFAISLSMLATALVSPILGAIADAGGRRKPWILVFSILAMVATAALWEAMPKADDVWWILMAVAVANFGFETASVFYNAMLPDLAPPGKIGRLSGWGWGLGYVGGLVGLIIALFVLVKPDPPLFGMDASLQEPVRATALLCAGWFAVFSWPFFIFTPDTSGSRLPAGEAVRQGLGALARTFGHLRRYRNIALYLLAHMVYADGLNTLFSVGGIYAAVTFGMDFHDLLLFGIALNITAGIGAFSFGWLDDVVGSKPTILIAVGSIAVLGTILLLVETRLLFWIFALPLGIFLGPAQSASRSLMARLAPHGMAGEMFGLYALSGRATAFIGPALFGAVTGITGSQRWGLATVLVFLLIGMALLVPVKAKQAGVASQTPL